MSDETDGTTQGNPWEPDGKLTSRALAVLIVDELVGAKLVDRQQFNRAVTIAAAEIDVRKALGDY